MLLHLPIVILATLAPTAISDTIPKFDITKECRYEAGGATEIGRCSRDETAALGQLETQWAKFDGVNKRTCVDESSIGGFTSYVELLTCLQMTSQAEDKDDSPRGQRPGTEPTSPQLGQPGVTVGVRHDPIPRPTR
jgi:hypothetical protein